MPVAIRRDDLGAALDPAAYPLLTTLFNTGVRGLLDDAASRHGFKPGDSYLSKCHLCLEIRSYLALTAKVHLPELQPLGFYENLAAQD